MEPMVFTAKHALGVSLVFIITTLYLGINWRYFSAPYRLIFAIVSLFEIGVLATVDTKDWLYFIFVFVLTSWLKHKVPRARSEWSEYQIKDITVLPKFTLGSQAWHFTNSMYAYVFVWLVDLMAAKQ